MDEHYWAKKYHEAEAERVDAQKRIEELEAEVKDLEKELENAQELIFEDQAEISRLMLKLGQLLRKIESRDVSRVVNK